MFKRAQLREEAAVDVVVLATSLSAIGYSCSVRQGMGGGTSVFRQLRHEFIVVRGDGDYAAADFIVDPCFRCVGSGWGRRLGQGPVQWHGGQQGGGPCCKCVGKCVVHRHTCEGPALRRWAGKVGVLVALAQ